VAVYIDASAMVAMIGREPEASSFGDRLKTEPDRLTSAIAVWETVRGVANSRGILLDEARGLVAEFLRAGGITLVPIGVEEADAALDAHSRFGKGVHEARLNMGDCFAYACTKLHADLILSKGEDFGHTDLKDAMLT
jgi:ribonuclease VapC